MVRYERHLLDAREMEHPEPLQRATAILRNLSKEAYLYMLHRKKPLPLLEIAERAGLRFCAREDDGGTWHIVITPAEMDPKDLCDV